MLVSFLLSKFVHSDRPVAKRLFLQSGRARRSVLRYGRMPVCSFADAQSGLTSAFMIALLTDVRTRRERERERSEQVKGREERKRAEIKCWRRTKREESAAGTSGRITRTRSSRRRKSRGRRRKRRRGRSERPGRDPTPPQRAFLLNMDYPIPGPSAFLAPNIHWAFRPPSSVYQHALNLSIFHIGGLDIDYAQRYILLPPCRS